MEVKKIWLEDNESTIIAPFTIMDAIQDNDGTSLKEYIETHGGSGGGGETSQVTYSNTKSDLAATNVQTAIDELSQRPVITIDNNFSKESENPLQNKIITEKIEELEKRVTEIQKLLDGMI